jgi:large subunit ribosomal protein L16
MFIPSQQKYKKYQKGKNHNKISPPFFLKFFFEKKFSLKSMESGRLYSTELVALYQTLNKYIKKSGRIIMNIYPQLPLCKKPIEVRMGKGKGNVAFWVANIKVGTILCNIIGADSTLALKALLQGKQKLSLKTKIL